MIVKRIAFHLLWNLHCYCSLQVQHKSNICIIEAFFVTHWSFLVCLLNNFSIDGAFVSSELPDIYGKRLQKQIF